MVQQQAGSPVEHCTHKRVTHRHGTIPAYTVCRCRCRNCADAVNAWQRDRARLRREGQWYGWVDIAPVREYIQEIHSDGMSPKAISAVSGVPLAVVCPVIYPDHAKQRSRIRRDNAEALLAVRHGDPRVPGNLLVSNVGTTRRIHALARVRWRAIDIGDLCDVTDRAVRAWTMGRCVEARVAHQMRGVYADLSERLGPSRITERRAEAAGVAAPWQWDGVDIDDPHAMPLPEVEDFGEMTKVEEKAARLEDLLRLAPVSWSDASERLGVAERTVVRWVRDSKREDLRDLLNRNGRLARGEDVA